MGHRDKGIQNRREKELEGKEIKGRRDVEFVQVQVFLFSSFLINFS